MTVQWPTAYCTHKREVLSQSGKLIDFMQLPSSDCTGFTSPPGNPVIFTTSHVELTNQLITGFWLGLWCLEKSFPYRKTLVSTSQINISEQICISTWFSELWCKISSAYYFWTNRNSDQKVYKHFLPCFSGVFPVAMVVEQHWFSVMVVIFWDNLFLINQPKCLIKTEQTIRDASVDRIVFLFCFLCGWSLFWSCTQTALQLFPNY